MQVDTRTVPPRATWVHPYAYADEQSPQNPEIGPADKLSGCELTDPPPYREKPERRHSFSDGKQSASLLLPNIAFPDKSMPDLNDHPHYEKRGFFAMLKDKVITVKEEREERKRTEQLQRERHADMLLRQSYLRQQLYCGNAPYHRSYYGCTAADAYPTTYPPPPGPPTPYGLSRGAGAGILVGGATLPVASRPLVLGNIC